MNKMNRAIFLFVLGIFVPLSIFAQSFPSADTIEQTEEEITKPYMERVLADVDGFETTVKQELADGWAPGKLGLFSYGMVDPANTTLSLDHIWNTGIPQTFGALGLADRDLPGQTVRCNASDFPKTHFHTYHALHTPAIRQCGWPGQDWFTGGGVPGNPQNEECRWWWWCPNGGVNEAFPAAAGYGEDLFAEFTSFMEVLSPILGVLNGGCRCCFIPCFWGCCVRHRCVHNTSYKPWQYQELGFPAGICIEAKRGWMNGELTCCPLRIEFANVVDYMYPTNQISISRQPYASRRLDLGENLQQNAKHLQYLIQNWMNDPEMEENRGVMQQAIQQLVEMSRSVQQVEARKSANLGEPPPSAPILDPTNPDSYLAALVANIFSGTDAGPQQAWDTLSSEQALFLSLALPKGDIDRGYFRIMDNFKVTQEIHGGNPGRKNRPPHFIMYHTDSSGNTVMGQPFLNSDYYHPATSQGGTTQQWGAKLAMWMDQSKHHNAPLYDSGSEADVIGRPEICARVNAFRGTSKHTPADLVEMLRLGEPIADWTNISGVKDTFDGNFHNYRCIRNVGEAFGHTSSVRPSNNAMIFQSLIRGMDQYERRYKQKTERYSSDWRELDRFSMLSGKRYELAQDYGGADVLAELLNSATDIASQLGGMPDNLEFPTTTRGEVNYKELNDAFMEDYDFGQWSCMLFEDMEPKRNYDLKALNRFDPKTVGMHGETNFEVYKMFSGCYGFPQKEDWCIQVFGVSVCNMIFRWFPSYFGNFFGELRLR